jgi:hypothetical protein
MLCSFLFDFYGFGLEGFRRALLFDTYYTFETDVIYHILLLDMNDKKLINEITFVIDDLENFDDVIIGKLYFTIYSQLSFIEQDLTSFTDGQNERFTKAFQLRIYKGVNPIV